MAAAASNATFQAEPTVDAPELPTVPEGVDPEFFKQNWLTQSAIAKSLHKPIHDNVQKLKCKIYKLQMIT